MGIRTWFNLSGKNSVRWTFELDHEHVMNSPCGSNLSEIRLCDPSVPMILEFGCSGASVLKLTKGELIDDIGIPGTIKKTWRDPRLLC